MRRLLILLAVIVAVNAVAFIVIFSRDGVEPGKIARGLPGYPLRGSLKDDQEAIDGAVVTWRETGKQPPGPDDPVHVLWIGEAPSGADLAVLEHRGRLAELVRGEEWELRDERLRGWDNGRGTLPIAIGNSIVVPAGIAWTFLNTGATDGFKPAPDGLFYAERSDDEEGFLVPRPATDGDYIPIYATRLGGARGIRLDDWQAFASAMNEPGTRRAVWLATGALTRQAGTPTYRGDPPMLTVTWTGEVPGDDRAALVVQRDQEGLGAALGYGEQGAVELGTGHADDTFAAGAFADVDGAPHLVLAGAGAVETIQAQVGGKTVRGTAPLAVLEADEGDFTVTGRTRDGKAVAGLER